VADLSLHAGGEGDTPMPVDRDQGDSDRSQRLPLDVWIEDLQSGRFGIVPLPGTGHGPGHRRQRCHLVVGLGDVPGGLLGAVPLPGSGLRLGHRPKRVVGRGEVAGGSLGQLHLPGGGLCPGHRLQRPEPARMGDAAGDLLGVGRQDEDPLRRVGEQGRCGHRDQCLGPAPGVGDAASLLLGPVPLPGPGQGLGQRPGGIGPRGAGDAGGDSIGLLPIMEVGLGSDDRDQRRLLAGRVGNAAGVPLDVGEEAGGSVPVDLGHCRADGSDRFGVPRHRVVPASKTLGALQQGNGSVGIVTGHGAAQRGHGRCLLPDVGNGSRGLFGAVPLARGGQGVHHRSQGPGSGGGVHRVDGVGRPLGMLPQPGAGERLGHSGEGERPHMGCGDAPGGLGGLLKQAEGTLPVRPDHRSAHRGQRPRLRICVGDLAPSSRVAASLPGPSER
jgi:hypothetical protein